MNKSKSITRYGYINTLSEAGRPSKLVFPSANVTHATVWTNHYGNPTTRLYLEDGTTIMCVDDYGVMNDIHHISPVFVQRKKDL